MKIGLLSTIKSKNIVNSKINSTAYGIKMTKPLNQDTLTLSFKGIVEDVGLVKAAQSGDIKKVEQLIKKGANVNAMHQAGAVLHYAADSNNLDLANLLIKYKANVDIQNNIQWTPLNVAVFKDNFEVAELLVKNKANIHIADHNNIEPLHHAAGNLNLKIMNLLVNHGADFLDKGKCEFTTLEIFAEMLHRKGYHQEYNYCQEAVYHLQQGVTTKEYFSKGLMGYFEVLGHNLPIK